MSFTGYLGLITGLLFLITGLCIWYEIWWNKKIKAEVQSRLRKKGIYDEQ